MKKNDLKKILKPIVKECIKEAILEEGILSNIISEVVKGVGNPQPIVEAKSKAPSKSFQNFLNWLNLTYFYGFLIILKF